MGWIGPFPIASDSADEINSSACKEWVHDDITEVLEPYVRHPTATDQLGLAAVRRQLDKLPDKAGARVSRY